jgi:hypothetical protein
MSNYNKEQAITLISKKRDLVFKVRNTKKDPDIQHACVNELSRLNKMMVKVKNADDDTDFIINVKPDLFEFAI